MRFGITRAMVVGMALAALAATAPQAAAQPGGKGRGIGAQVSAAARSGVHGQQLAGYIKQLQAANGIGGNQGRGPIQNQPPAQPPLQQKGRGQGRGQGLIQPPVQPPMQQAKPQKGGGALMPPAPVPAAKPALPGANQVPVPVPLPQQGKGMVKGKGQKK